MIKTLKLKVMEALLQYLNGIYPLSGGLTEHLQSILKTREAGKKEFLLKAGHTCRWIWFVQQGLLRCYYDKEGVEICSWFMSAGDVIISVESFFQQKPSYESIQVIEDSLLYYIDYRELQAIYHRYPEFNFIGRVLTERYYTLSEQRLYSLRMQRAQDRYDYIRQHFPELILKVPAKYLASYLGITEVTLSKIKSRK